MCYLENAGVSLGYKPSPRLSPCPRKENTSGSPGILGVVVCPVALQKQAGGLSKPVCKAGPYLKNKKGPPRRESLGVFEKQNKKFGVLALTKLESLVWRGQQFLKFILEFILLTVYVYVGLCVGVLEPRENLQF